MPQEYNIQRFSSVRYGRPEIFNTDQGRQFTSDDFTDTLKRHGVMISMDGKGRCMDNIFVERLWRSLKYEEVVCCGSLAAHEVRRSFIEDGGRPSGIGLQGQIPNRHKLRG
jgi:transposase InsO family protein